MNPRPLLLLLLAVLGGIVAITDPWAIPLIVLAIGAYPATVQPILRLLAGIPLCVLINVHAPRIGTLAVLLLLALLITEEGDRTAFLLAAIPSAALVLALAPEGTPVAPSILLLGVTAGIIILALLIAEYRQTIHFRESP